MIAPERIALALDLVDPERLLTLVDQLAPHVGVFKLGSIPYAAGGPDLVRQVAKSGEVFLDLKLHDIPNTVAGAVRELARLGVSLLTVHAAGGTAMIEAALEAARSVPRPPRVLAVTVLTHMEESDLRDTGVGRTVAAQVEGLARMALQAGADGIVCSPLEVAALRRALGPKVFLVVPGVRPRDSAAGDQRRIATPADALASGADLLVIGRPIVDAPDPVAAAERIRREA